MPECQTFFNVIMIAKSCFLLRPQPRLYPAVAVAAARRTARGPMRVGNQRNDSILRWQSSLNSSWSFFAESAAATTRRCRAVELVWVLAHKSWDIIVSHDEWSKLNAHYSSWTISDNQQSRFFSPFQPKWGSTFFWRSIPIFLWLYFSIEICFAIQ